MKCNKCGESFDWIVAQGLMVDLGTKVFPDPRQCAGGGEHDFIPDYQEEDRRGHIILGDEV